METMVTRARLRLFGHVLRLDRKTPAQMSMDLYFSAGKRRVGRPVSCLATALVADMKRSRRSFKNAGDLASIRLLASDRDAWKDLTAKHLP